MRKLTRLAVLCVAVACVTGIGVRYYGAVAQETGKAAAKAEKPATIHSLAKVASLAMLPPR